METLAPKSRTEIKSYLQHGNVMHNGQVTTQFDEQLQHDDELVINFTRPFATLKSRMARVIWEDDDIVVIEKKSATLNSPGANFSTREKVRLAPGSTTHLLPLWPRPAVWFRAAITDKLSSSSICLKASLLVESISSSHFMPKFFSIGAEFD